MSDGYYRDVVKILKQHNCRKLRQDGSHQTWCNSNNSVFFTVSTSLKSRHTANHIMKEAGINYKF